MKVWYQRGFYCGDQSISEPVQDETVPTMVLLVLCYCLVTLPVIIFEKWIVRPSNAERYRCCLSRCQLWCQPILAGIYISFMYGLVFSIDLLLKYSVGELRPNFIDICQPDWSAINCTDSNGNPLYVFPIPCNETSNYILQRARTSFPSGHATLAAFTATVIILYLCVMFPKSSQQFHLVQSTNESVKDGLDPGTESKSPCLSLAGLNRLCSNINCRINLIRALVILVQTLLVLFALSMGISRVWDHVHHWWDVLAGFIFGILWGIITFAVKGYVFDISC